MKIKVKESVYTIKPKQTEGKLVVRNDDFAVKPKQAEGKLMVRSDDFAVKPKPDGVRIYRAKNRSVIKTDRRCGVRVYRSANSSVLKGDRRSGVRLYRAQNNHVLKQTCDGTIFTWDAVETIFRPPSTAISSSTVSSVSAFLFNSGLLSRIYNTERPIVIGITWSNTISGGCGGVNFPDGTYPDYGSPVYHFAEIRKTPTAVNNSAGSVLDRIIGLTAMSGDSGVTFTFDSAEGRSWLRFQAGLTGTPPYSIPAGTKQIRDITVRNVSNGNAFMHRFYMGFRII